MVVTTARAGEGHGCLRSAGGGWRRRRAPEVCRYSAPARWPEARRPEADTTLLAQAQTQTQTRAALGTCIPLLKAAAADGGEPPATRAVEVADLLRKEFYARDDVCAAAVYAEAMACGLVDELDSAACGDHVWRMARRAHGARELLGAGGTTDEGSAREARRRVLREAGTRAVAIECARTLREMRLAARHTPGATAGPKGQELALRASQLHAPLARALRLGVVPLVASRDRANAAAAIVAATPSERNAGVELESLALAALVPRAWERARAELAVHGAAYDELLEAQVRTLVSALGRAPWVAPPPSAREELEQACADPKAETCLAVYQGTMQKEGAMLEKARFPLSELHKAFADLPWPLTSRLEVAYRRKSLTSAMRKMLRTGAEVPSDLRDLLGIRVVVHEPALGSTVDDDDDLDGPDSVWREARAAAACYAVKAMMDALPAFGEPIPLRTKDYIASPKLENGYQSLHATYCVRLPEEPRPVFVEAQIRTAAMHREAEYGSARHEWYKGGVVQLSDWHAAALASLPSDASFDDEAEAAAALPTDYDMRRSWDFEELDLEENFAADSAASRVAAALRGAVHYASQVSSGASAEAQK